MHHKRRPYRNCPRGASVRAKVTVEARFGIGDSRFCFTVRLPDPRSEEYVFSASFPAIAARNAFFIIYFRWHIKPPRDSF